MSELHTNGSCNCASSGKNSSFAQTLNEMEFHRGIWPGAINGDIVQIERCLRKGIDIDTADKYGYTALHYASRNGYYDVCKILLDAGAKVDCLTTNGKSTPLHRSASMGHLEIVKLLLDHSANCCRQDVDGKTAAHKAAENGHRQIVQILFDFNSSVKGIRDLQGKTVNDYLTIKGLGHVGSVQ